jgi:filamentous hemagglutinin family protein
MNLKPIQLSCKQQLWDVLVRNFRNSNSSRILPLVVKKLGISVILFLIIPTVSVEAQVTPDESLSTNVEQQGENQLNINGGEREGNNLFHSFEEFSVPEGIEAVFENALDIENIFTRITGEEASAINGILRTQGGANFFLVNSNGIVFGENAQLDVGGSFIATTANSVKFEDGTEFIADDAGEKPILTVSVPIGLQFEGSSGAITVNGMGNQITTESLSQPTNISTNSSGLSVDSARTLALVGSNVNLTGGLLTANGSKIEIGSVSAGVVSLNSTTTGWNLGYAEVSDFKDIALSQQALVNASGTDEGSVQVNGANVTLADGSKILLQNQGETQPGNLQINATDSLTLQGKNPNGQVGSGIQAETISSGRASDLSVNTQRLVLRDGARIGSNTYSEASGGNVVISASDFVQIVENSSNIINASTYASGDAGSINLSTNKLRITDGGGISSSTLGSGSGGNLSVEAENIELIGILSEPDSLSAISAVSFSPIGNAGNITVNTDTLRIIDGGAVSTTSLGDGTAGNVTVNASNSIEISGQTDDFSSSISSAVITEGDPDFRIQRGIPEIPGGSSGNVAINTSLLQVNQGGEISVENGGTGNAGTLFINADKINFNAFSNIIAETESGLGGNINIDADSLQLDENSSVTATANNNGDGGNITINTTSLIAKKNSEVTANAFNGRGGNLDINAEGLFLFDSPSNIFSASSELGIDGTIQINTPDIDLQRELEQSELELPTTEEAIAGSCLARSNQQGSFTVNNGTGLPKSPNSNYSDLDSTLTGISSLPQTAKQPEVIEKSNRQLNTLMLPAERMVKTENGRVFLVAAPALPESLFCPKN